MRSSASRILLALVCMVLGGPGVVMAQAAPDLAADRDDDFARSGLYLGAGLTGAVWYTQLQDDLDATPSGAEVEVGPGFDARLGYRVHPRVAAELEFQWLSPNEITIGTGKLAELESWNVTANAKAYLLTGSIQPYVLVGGGLMHAEVKGMLGIDAKSDGQAFAARSGGGIDFYVTRSVVFAFETSYVLPIGDLRDLDAVSFSLGLQYRF